MTAAGGFLVGRLQIIFGKIISHREEIIMKTWMKAMAAAMAAAAVCGAFAGCGGEKKAASSASAAAAGQTVKFGFVTGLHRPRRRLWPGRKRRG